MSQYFYDDTPFTVIETVLVEYAADVCMLLWEGKQLLEGRPRVPRRNRNVLWQQQGKLVKAAAPGGRAACCPLPWC